MDELWFEKMVEEKAFLIKPRHRYYLSQWVECVCGAQSWKKIRLLSVSVFVPIDGWTLIIKNGAKCGFSYETKASTYLSQWEEWNYGAQSLKEWELLCESIFIQLKDED